MSTTKQQAVFPESRGAMNRRMLIQGQTGSSRWPPRRANKAVLSSGTKELAELAALLVLRCDDCISYHVNRRRKLGDVGSVVGDSIVIPYLRRAGAPLDDNEE